MLKAYSVQRLNWISKKKEIWCFGCGKRFYDMVSLYSDEPFVTRISRLIDNNKLLWGKKKDVGRKQIPICSSDSILMDGNKHIIVLITSDSYQEIYAQISEVVDKIGMVCSRYPVSYYMHSTLLMSACRLLPMRKQLLFNAGKEPHENAKAIVEYLREKYKGDNYKIVFVADDGKAGSKRDKGIIEIDRNTLKCRNHFKWNIRYCYYSATSKYLFYENEPLEKVRKGQVLIYLNHGLLPLKNVKDVLRQPEYVDYALCPSPGCAEIYTKQYNVPREKLLYVMSPRVVYLTENVHKLDRVVQYKGKQVLIWLPTFRALKGTDRKDSAVDNILPLLADKGDFAKVNATLEKNEQLLLIKCHPREQGKLHIPLFCENIKLLREEELEKANVILQEILGGTAALITDYSGISFEYLLLNHPIAYVISDINYYTKGFAFENPYDYMPGVKISTMVELLDFLDDIRLGRDEFQDMRRELMEKLFQGNELKNGARELVKLLEELR